MDPLPERRYAKALEIVKDLKVINRSAGSRVFRTNAAASSMDLRRTAVATGGGATASRTSAPTSPRRTIGAAPAGLAAASATSTFTKPRQLPVAPIKPVSPKEKSAIIPLIIMLVLAIIILASSLYLFSKLQQIRKDREGKLAPDPSMEPYIPVAKPKPKAR
jgi:cobalamin biosynthesis Mg chelatase CobN